MTDQFEIYRSAADRYQELVGYEDVDGQLAQLLHRELTFHGPAVIEAGVGTGRVTALYAEQAQQIYAYDQSEHMVNYARQRFIKQPQIQLEVKSHAALLAELPEAHLFIEGWAFGHWFLELYPDYQETFDHYFKTLKHVLREPAQIVLIETLGTYTEVPFSDQKLNHFYDYLITEQGFQQHTIRTDYQFPSLEKAVEVMGFFFGEEMAQKLQKYQRTRIPEYTGVWIWNPS